MLRILLYAMILCVWYSYAQTIQIGTGNTYNPFAYLDADMEVIDFDIDVLKMLEYYDTTLHLSLHPLVQNALFVGLDSGKFDILAHQIVKTQERKEKYIFSDIPYFYISLNFVVKENFYTSSYEYLKNKQIGVVIGSNQALKVEDWESKHKDLNVKIIYFKNYGIQFLTLANNQIDVLLNKSIVTLDCAKARNIKNSVTNLVLQCTPVFFVFPKNKVILKDRVLKALLQAKMSGKLEDLSMQYFDEYRT